MGGSLIMFRCFSLSPDVSRDSDETMPVVPCRTCPWRVSTPPRGFPGGLIDVAKLLPMIRGEAWKVMQCHCTPDESPRACVGYMLQAGMDTIFGRLAVAHGLVDSNMGCADPLHTLESLIETHGGYVIDVFKMSEA